MAVEQCAVEPGYFYALFIQYDTVPYYIYTDTILSLPDMAFLSRILFLLSLNNK